MRRLLPLLATLAGLALAPTAAHAYTFYDWDVTTSAGAQPTSIAASGSTLYFTLSGSDDIGRISTGGVPLSTVDGAGGTSRPQQLTLGPDGTMMWFADPASDKIGKLDPANGVTEPIALGAGADPYDLTVGHDQRIWAIENGNGGKIDCVDPVQGALGAPAFSLDYAGAPIAVATATDGAIWFADQTNNKLGRVEPAAAACGQPLITRYDFTGPFELAAAAGGDMYVASPLGLTRVHGSGPTLSTTPVSGLGASVATAMHNAADGSAWYVDAGRGRIGKVTGTAVAAEYALPRGTDNNPSEFTFTPDKALWYTGANTGGLVDLIGRFSEEVGQAGPIGPPGQDGDDGQQGIEGLQGQIGPIGPGGPQGPQGAPGPTGATGANGLRGAAGPQGPRGSRGPRGKAGPQGKTLKCGQKGSGIKCKVVVGGGEARVRVSVVRGGKVYARTSRTVKRRSASLNVHKVRRMRAGRYTVVVTIGDVTLRVPLRIT